MGLYIGSLNKDKLPVTITNEMLSRHKIYGIKFDGSSSAGVPTYDNIGMRWNPATDASEGIDDYKDVAPFNVKKFVSTYDASATSRRTAPVYEGDANYASLRANANYDCFVELPKGYYYRPSMWEWLVSPDPIDGFSPDPAHDKGDGSTFSLVARSEYDLSSGFKSRPDVKPLAEQTLQQFLTGSNARGIYLQSYQVHCWINILRLIKQKDLNSQKVNGYGCAEGNATHTMTDNIKGLDGYRTSVDGNECVRTLGIQNFYGNVWDFIGNCLTNNSQVYVASDPRITTVPSNVTAALNDGWKKLSGTTVGPASGGSPFNKIAFDTANSYAMFPTNLGGDDYNPIGDYTWNANNDPWSVVKLGSNAWYGLKDGSFAWSSADPLSVSDIDYGAAACIFTV